jgi:hypothetical protein
MEDLDAMDDPTDSWPRTRVFISGILLAFAAMLYFTPVFAQSTKTAT